MSRIQRSASAIRCGKGTACVHGRTPHSCGVLCAGRAGAAGTAGGKAAGTAGFAAESEVCVQGGGLRSAEGTTGGTAAGTVVQLFDSAFVPDNPDLAGSSGVRNFTYDTAKAGSGTLIYELLPPGSTTPDNTVTFTVTVAG